MFRNAMRKVYLRFWGSPMDHRTYQSRSVSDAFSRIYRNKVWGDNGEQFYSGPGSHGPAADLYCAAVIDFIKENGVRSVVDCGCGDFSVGRRIAEATGVQYTGVDVVPELIEHHKTNVQNDRIRFVCADITRDRLPDAELCLVRQVFQHLTNAEIASALPTLDKFVKVIVSEDLPLEPESFNHDMTHGPEVRSDFGSGVYIDQPPFSKQAKELWKFQLTGNSVLRSVLMENSQVDPPQTRP